MPPPPPPSPSPDQIEGAIAEILLRLPPDEPEHLFRAALVCKPWLCILCDPGFLRRYRAFHGSPPLLGLFNIQHTRKSFGEPFPRLVTTTLVPAGAFPQSARTERRFTRLLDCRHGRVLVFIHMGHSDCGDCGYLIVWDPITRDSHALTLPQHNIPRTFFNAAVFCATQGCNHLDCHGGPFGVAFVATHNNTIFANMYSSKTGEWSTTTPLICIGRADLYLFPMRGIVLGDDEVCFALTSRSTAFATVKYNWSENCLIRMNAPPPPHLKEYFALMAMEDGSLGLAVIVGSRLYIDSRNVNTDGAALWMQCRVIDLEKVMSMAELGKGGEARAVGFAEGVGAIFVSTRVGLFTIELKSERVKKVDESATGFGDYFSVLPYMSFYTPDSHHWHGLRMSIVRLNSVRLRKTLRNE